MQFKLREFLTVITLLCIPILFCQDTKAIEDGRYGIFDVRISPDGNSVAFSWQGDIWIADIDSGECTRITDHVAYDHHPAWFPDSGKLAFSSNRDGNDDVYSVAINGSEITRHTWHGVADVVLDVAPGGEHILFKSARFLNSDSQFFSSA